MYTLEVLNPDAVMQGQIESHEMAPRDPSLAGKRVGLIWNAKRGGDIALDRAGEQIKKRYPDVEVIRFDGNMPCAPDLLEKAMQECDVFVGSTGD